MYYVEAHPGHTHSPLRKSPRMSPGFVCNRVLPNCWGSIYRPTQLRFSPDLLRRRLEQFARCPLLGTLVPRVCLFIGWYVCIIPTRRACYFSFSAPRALFIRSLRFSWCPSIHGDLAPFIFFVFRVCSHFYEFILLQAISLILWTFIRTKKKKRVGCPFHY